MAENHFDQACRHLLHRLDTRGLLTWLLGLESGDFTFHGWLDTRSIPFPGQPERFCDTVAHLTDEAANGVPWALPVEFQIVPDNEMPGRFLEYLGRLWRDKKPDPNRGSRFSVGAVVVNLTGTGSSSSDSDWGKADIRTLLRVREVNLAQFDADDILGQIERGEATRSLLPWTPLMQQGDHLAIINRWIAVASTEPNDRWRADYGALALIFAEATNCRNIWQQALKGWQAVQSQQVLEWKEEARIEAKAEAIVEILEVKFTSIPQDLSDSIRATTERDKLDAWFPVAVRCSSPEDFRKATGL